MECNFTNKLHCFVPNSGPFVTIQLKILLKFDLKITCKPDYGRLGRMKLEVYFSIRISYQNCFQFKVARLQLIYI